MNLTNSTHFKKKCDRSLQIHRNRSLPVNDKIKTVGQCPKHRRNTVDNRCLDTKTEIDTANSQVVNLFATSIQNLRCTHYYLSIWSVVTT